MELFSDRHKLSIRLHLGTQRASQLISRKDGSSLSPLCEWSMPWNIMIAEILSREEQYYLKFRDKNINFGDGGLGKTEQIDS